MWKTRGGQRWGYTGTEGKNEEIEAGKHGTQNQPILSGARCSAKRHGGKEKRKGIQEGQSYTSLGETRGFESRGIGKQTR